MAVSKIDISIVTISFNQGEFLERCISSVINVISSRVEYILVDAGSTDRSLDVIDKYRDRIDHLIIESDRGPADGLNKGIQKARGKYVFYINADDFIYPEAWLCGVAHILGNPTPDVWLMDAFIVNRAGDKKKAIYSTRFSGLLFQSNVCKAVQQGTFIKAAAFRRTNGFNVDNRVNWDTELLIDLLLVSSKFSLHREFVGGFRHYAGTITCSPGFDEQRLINRKRLISKLPERNRMFVSFLAIFLKAYKHFPRLRFWRN